MNKQLEWENFENLIDESWEESLRPFIESEECYNIYQVLKAAPKGEIIPKSNLLWRPFLECKKQDLKTIWIGLSPYHTRVNNKDFADGLTFSTKLDKTPPSLQLLQAAIEDDLSLTGLKENDLTFLADQGVLLLNAALTTSYGKAGNHVDLWLPFHKYMYQNVYSKINGLIFVYFGKEASKLVKYETPFIHYSKVVEHPSFAARQNREFNHEKLFSWTNGILKENNGKAFEIDWVNYSGLPF
jgi:uracil-DNA glycosylase